MPADANFQYISTARSVLRRTGGTAWVWAVDMKY